MHRVLARVAGFAIRRRVAVVTGTVLLGLAATVLAARAPLRVDVLQAFRPESRIARTYRFLDERLTATLPVDVVVEVGEGVDRARVVEELDRFGREVLAIEGVDSALSAATLVRYGRAISPVDPGDAGALVFLRRVLPRIVRRFEDDAQAGYRVKLRVREGTPPSVLDRIEDAAREFTVGPATVQGLFVQAVRTTRAIRSDLLFGVLGMGVGVGCLVALVLRSARAGVAAFFPNVVPAALVFGGAAVAGIPLDVSAVAVGGVAVGLAVDDTLHLLWRFARERREGLSMERALVAASTTVGRALLGSTLVLAAGLGSLAFSSFVPTARFGLFAAAASVLALFADLLLVPALIGAPNRREGAGGRTMPGMFRHSGWLLAALLLLAACEDNSSKKDPLPVGPRATDPQPPPVEPVSPPTGIVKIEEMRKLARDDLERIEEELGERAPDDGQRRSLGFVKGALEKARTAAEIGSRQEARQLVEERYGRLRKQQGELQETRSKVWGEIGELKTLVAGIEAGTATPPSGFSEAEIRDKLDDAMARAKDLDTKDEELRAGMKVCEDLMAQEVIEPTERTRFTDELEAIAALQARVEALLGR